MTKSVTFTKKLTKIVTFSLGLALGTALLLLCLRSKKNLATDENQLSMRNISQENLQKTLFTLADMIEKRVEVATKRADNLTQAILAKAFRGELVLTEADLARREGHDYEPSPALLDAFKATRPRK